MKIILASPRGFCAGVHMAVASLERALEIHGPPFFVYHQIVHNNWVVREFERRGAVFVDDLQDVPAGGTLMFSAHGVSPAIRRRAKQLGLTTIDATCPLVSKVHREAARFLQQGFTVFLIGHAGHDEVVGTLGIDPRVQLVQREQDCAALKATDPDKTAYVMQTTLSVDDAARIVARLRKRFPAIVGPDKDDICYATQNRQQAIKDQVAKVDAVLVVGSPSSSNSLRLKEVASSHGRPAFLVDGPQHIDTDWFRGDETVLITAGASAPDNLVQETIRYLRQHYHASVEELPATEEHRSFPLPVELRA